MRFTGRTLSLIFLVVCALSAASAQTLTAQTPAPSHAVDAAEDADSKIDEVAVEMLLQEPKLCCLTQKQSIPPSTIVGLLLWARIKILCQSLRPTAIC